MQDLSLDLGVRDDPTNLLFHSTYNRQAPTLGRTRIATTHMHAPGDIEDSKGDVRLNSSLGYMEQRNMATDIAEISQACAVASARLLAVLLQIRERRSKEQVALPFALDADVSLSIKRVELELLTQERAFMRFQLRQIKAEATMDRDFNGTVSLEVERVSATNLDYIQDPKSKEYAWADLVTPCVLQDIDKQQSSWASRDSVFSIWVEARAYDKKPHTLKMLSHFEVNVAPLTIRLTHDTVSRLVRFFSRGQHRNRRQIDHLRKRFLPTNLSVLEIATPQKPTASDIQSHIDKQADRSPLDISKDIVKPDNFVSAALDLYYTSSTAPSAPGSETQTKDNADANINEGKRRLRRMLSRLLSRSRSSSAVGREVISPTSDSISREGPSKGFSVDELARVIDKDALGPSSGRIRTPHGLEDAHALARSQSGPMSSSASDSGCSIMDKKNPSSEGGSRAFEVTYFRINPTFFILNYHGSKAHNIEDIQGLKLKLKNPLLYQGRSWTSEQLLKRLRNDLIKWSLSQGLGDTLSGWFFYKLGIHKKDQTQVGLTEALSGTGEETADMLKTDPEPPETDGTRDKKALRMLFGKRKKPRASRLLKKFMS